jgi:predicted nucleic acid-binding protein
VATSLREARNDNHQAIQPRVQPGHQPRQEGDVPDPRPIRDALIAATALVHGLTVVTRNVSDFASTGAKVVNPWL